MTRITEAVTINRPANFLYMYWRDLSNLPTFLSHLKEVKETDAIHSHWVATGALGTDAEWDAEITRDVPGEALSWRSLEGSMVGTTGEITFRPSPDDRGTIVHVTMEVAAPGGKVGEMVAKLFGDDPRKQIHEDLRHFKQVMEAGEIPTVDGQPRGAGKHSSEADRKDSEKNPETSILTDIAHKALH